MANKSDIRSFTELYQHALTDKQWLGPFVAGHLMVEFMLRKLIGQYDPKLVPLADKMRHHELIDLNSQIETISSGQRDLLISINQMRNRLAHRIDYSPTVHELQMLWQLAAGSVSDLTDGIAQGREVLDTIGAVDDIGSWVFSELFIQISYDLHNEFTELGGDIETL
ncbi:hypothetical protein [Erythrobacter sp.]|uniref:hypothetical protein n=1 Tax=Erythrobacter sp. TaxID=1042 RepID=UPI001B0B16F4|nr:hypothetical protein [Erythrobacter sp.]MBO6528395.1 hypothetical protein [Erythrobacter sp.]MBO6531298.1 hypothetical protein [Erythrobacter sp.]